MYLLLLTEIICPMPKEHVLPKINISDVGVQRFCLNIIQVINVNYNIKLFNTKQNMSILKFRRINTKTRAIGNGVC